MKKQKIFLTFILIVKSISSLYTFGPNLLVNHDFSVPIIQQGDMVQLFSSQILGWNCTDYCEIGNCQRLNLWTATVNIGSGFSGDCPSQAIDTSAYYNEVISQQFQAQAGQHQLSIKFILPILSPNQKTLIVKINQKVAYKYQPPAPDFNYKDVSMKIMLRDNINKVAFTHEGNNGDATGFRIFDIKIRRIITPQVDGIIDSISSNDLLSNMVAIPCSRILFGQFMNTMIYFDRMQLYYYHHRRYSYYYNIFIKGISNLLNEKGNYATLLSDKLFSLIGTSKQQIQMNVNFKKGRKYKDGYDKNNFMQNGGFLFIVSSLPIAFVIFFIFNTMFRFTFNLRFSKILRKYSFFSLILLMLFQGNIEQFAFLVMDEFLEYFSACTTHKIINIAILIIFYFIVFCSTGFYLFCWYIHKKKTSYFTDNIFHNIPGITAFTFERGILCLVLGSAHRLTLLLGKQQLLILAAVQILLLIPKIFFFQFTSYKSKKIVWLNFTEALIRILFISSIYAYEVYGDLSAVINQHVHLRIIFLFFLVWTLNILFTVIESIKEQFFQKDPSQSLKSIQRSHNNRKIHRSNDVPSSFLRQSQHNKKTLILQNNQLRVKIIGKKYSLIWRRTSSL